MQIKELFGKFDELQLVYGDKSLDSVYGAGEISSPDLFFVFMNPTGKNVSSDKSWTGIKAPWLGTKNIWKMFCDLGLFDSELLAEIRAKRIGEWDVDFAERVYSHVKRNSMYITNLSKATQIDARPLKNEVFRDYLDLFREEILAVNPRVIITFGNQVSSILLGKSVSVSDYRKKFEILEIGGKKFFVYPVYYPVGQGMRNMGKAREDIDWIMKKFNKKL